jgi:hypothetical protein
MVYRVLVALIFLFFQSAHGADLGASASLKAYELFKNRSCGPVHADDVLELESAVCADCAAGAVSNKTPIVLGTFSDMEEELFFDFAAQKQVDALSCRIAHLDPIANSKSLTALEDKAILDLATKLPHLRTLSRRLKYLKNRIAEIELRLVSSKGLGPDEPARLMKESQGLSKEADIVTPALASLFETLWMSEDPMMAKYIEKAVDSSIEPYDFILSARSLHKPNLIPDFLKKDFSFRANAILAMRSEAQDSHKKFIKQSSLDKGQRIFKLNDKTKELIVRQGEILPLLKQDNPEMLLGLACRLNGRYGEGPEIVNKSLIVGSFVLGGAGVIAKLALVGKIGAALTAEQAAISTQAAKVLLTASSGVGSIQVLSKIKKNCGSISAVMKPTNSCDSSHSWEKSEIAKIDNGNCALSITMIAAPVIAAKLAGFLPSLSKFRELSKLGRNTGLAVQETAQVSKLSQTPAIKNWADPQWSSFSSEAQVGVKASIEESPAVYIKAIRQNHPQIRFLKSLGYKFHVDHAKLTVDVPPFEEVMTTIETRINGLVKSGRLGKDDILVPARVFVKGSKYVFVRFGESIPKGYKTYNTLLSNGQFERALAEGYYPIGEPTKVLQGQRTLTTEHDLAHFSTFLDHPDAMANLRKAMQRFAESGKYQNAAQERRLFYFNEFHEYVSPAQSGSFDSFISKSGLALKEDFVSATQVKSQLAHKSVAEMKTMLRELDRRQFQEPIGGSPRDLVTQKFELGRFHDDGSERGADDIAHRDGVFLASPRGIVDIAIRDGALAGSDRAKIEDALARAIAANHNSKNIDPLTFITEATQPNLKKSDNLYRYVCGSGSWATTTDFYEAFCTDYLRFRFKAKIPKPQIPK